MQCPWTVAAPPSPGDLSAPPRNPLPWSSMSNSRRAKRFATEGAVIVASILLAFGIDASWDASQARRTESTVLESIRTETEQNRGELDRLLERNENQFIRINLFLEADDTYLRALPQDSVFPWLSAMITTWTFDGDDSAAGLFLNSSAPVTPYAREIRGVLARWVRIADDLDEEKNTFWDLGVVAAGHLASHVAPAAQGDSGMLPEIAAELGPELLAKLRSDEAYVSALLNKAHYQGVYTEELGDASEALDSLRSVLQRKPGTRR